MVWREQSEGWRDLLGLTTALLVLLSSRMVMDMAMQVRMGSLTVQDASANIEQTQSFW
ncbi:MAG: hypothetical protein HC924_09400 [Synechococcaceae cyanobacterium SM2_3_2]|nr:hypothetical protein [Synechococcaceae cyanobacterium SM2_3_2]